MHIINITKYVIGVGLFIGAAAVVAVARKNKCTVPQAVKIIMSKIITEPQFDLNNGPMAGQRPDVQVV